MTGHLLLLAGNGHTYRASGIPPRVARRVPGIEQRVVRSAGNEVAAGEADYLPFAPAIDLEPAPNPGVILAPPGQADGTGGLIVHWVSVHGQDKRPVCVRGERLSPHGARGNGAGGKRYPGRPARPQGRRNGRNPPPPRRTGTVPGGAPHPLPEGAACRPTIREQKKPDRQAVGLFCCGG